MNVGLLFGGVGSGITLQQMADYVNANFYPRTQIDAILGALAGYTPEQISALLYSAPLVTPQSIGNFTVPTGKNAAVVQDVTITGVLTVPSGSTFVVINGDPV